jgi:hypothetical protein
MTRTTSDGSIQATAYVERLKQLRTASPLDWVDVRNAFVDGYLAGLDFSIENYRKHRMMLESAKAGDSHPVEPG